VTYRWAEGEFWMDPGPLRARLKKARLILGDVRDTIGEVMGEPKLAPIGFVAFDLDYHSSTRDALIMFDADPRRLLPRIFCHVDDAIGDDWELHCEHVGELLAIREFNETHEHRKLAPIHGLAHKRAIDLPAASMASASRSLLMICSGLCMIRFMVESLQNPSGAHRDSHSRWFSFWGACQQHCASGRRRNGAHGWKPAEKR
jgi:hypothetical protein